MLILKVSSWNFFQNCLIISLMKLLTIKAPASLLLHSFNFQYYVTKSLQQLLVRQHQVLAKVKHPKNSFIGGS